MSLTSEIEQEIRARIRQCEFYLMPDDSNDLSKAIGGPASFGEATKEGVKNTGGTALYIVAVEADGAPIMRVLLKPPAQLNESAVWHSYTSQTQKGAEVERITAAELLAALKEGDPGAFVGERGNGHYVIDGEFNLAAIAERLSERLQRRSA